MIADGQRDYREGERLVINQLGPFTRGTTPPGDARTAVCLRDGVCLVATNLSGDIRAKYDLPATGPVRMTFMQLPNRPEQHRDAFVFENTRTILVNEMPIGTEMCVYDEFPHEEEPAARTREAAHAGG